MEFKDKINQSVAAAVAKIMGEALHPNQQKLDVHEPEKDKLTADDFKKLRAKKDDKKMQEASFPVPPGYPAFKKKKPAPSVPPVKNEEVEQIDELSKTTLGSYVNKASDNAARNAAGSVGMANVSLRARNPRVKAAAEKYSDEDEATKQKRLSGIGKAVSRLAKEDVEQLDEYTPGPDGRTMIKGRAYGASKPEGEYVKGPSDAELKKIEAEKKKKPVTEEHGSAPKKRGMMGLKAYLTSKKSE
jgi:hypothetical protein